MKKIILLIMMLSLSLTACVDKPKEEKEKTQSVTREENSENLSEDASSKDAENSKEEVKEDTNEQKGENVSYNLGAIKEEIMAKIGAKDGLNFGAEAFNVLYGIDASDIKQCAGFSVMEGTFPHEVVMVEATDNEAAKRIEKAFQTKINAFAEQSKNYDAENYALAKKCKVEKSGRFYAMFLSPDYEDIKAVYNKYIK